MAVGKTVDGEIMAAKAEADALGVAFSADIPAGFNPAAALLPREWAMARCVLAGSLDGRDVLLMSSAADMEALEGASRAAGRVFEPIVVPRPAIAGAVGRAYGETATQPADPPAQAAVQVAGEREPDSGADGDLLSGEGGTPAIRFINSMLLKAISDGASDIHIEPFADGMSVRFRIDGVLFAREAPSRSLGQPVVSRLKVMAGMDISERRLPQDGMAEVRLGDRKTDIRVSSIPVAFGERIVLRLLNRDDARLPLDALGMDGDLLCAFRGLMSSPNGIVAISGPTGSGKTTTLYAALGEIDSAHRNILTIEDPVEYRLPGVGQMQVKPKIGLTFANGLRHILRQDPDVILVGETRDPETAEIAVRASLTGHLVLTTLHTNDAPSAVVRLTDMGVAPYLVASSLRGVLAQRLVRRLCPHCRRRTAATGADLARSFVDAAWRERLSAEGAWEAAGCDRCFGGRRGRTGVFELMACGPAVSALVRDGVADSEALRNAAGADGFFAMSDDALRKIAAGETGFADVAGVIG